MNTQARDRHHKRFTKSVYSNRTWEIVVEPGQEPYHNYADDGQSKEAGAFGDHKGVSDRSVYVGPIRPDVKEAQRTWLENDISRHVDDLPHKRLLVRRGVPEVWGDTPPSNPQHSGSVDLLPRNDGILLLSFLLLPLLTVTVIA